jgi:hypothetical protein
MGLSSVYDGCSQRMLTRHLVQRPPSHRQPSRSLSPANICPAALLLHVPYMWVSLVQNPCSLLYPLTYLDQTANDKAPSKYRRDAGTAFPPEGECLYNTE